MRRLDANNKLLGKAGDAQIAQGASYSGALHATLREASSSEDLKKISMGYGLQSRFEDTRQTSHLLLFSFGVLTLLVVGRLVHVYVDKALAPKCAPPCSSPPVGLARVGPLPPAAPPVVVPTGCRACAF